MFYSNLGATGWQVFVMHENVSQGNVKESLWFTLIFFCEKRDSQPCATESPMIVSMFLFLSHCVLDIVATGKWVNHGGKFGIKTHVSFNLYGPENTTKSTETT